MSLEQQPPPAAYFLTPGQVLAGTYRIVRPIGCGGMGEVYQASHERLPGAYAVKLLSGETRYNEEALRRFKQEAEVSSRLRHPNIVQVIDFDRMPDGTPYLVMEFLEGHDLSVELRLRGRLPLGRVLDLVEQIASGLAAAHEANVVHRDLKPANLFLSKLPGRQRELVRILDFGVSKVRDSGEALTRTHTLLGTPRYMSPEQARGAVSEIDGRTDQFALAAIAYEMLAGQPAFDGQGIATLVYQVVHQPAPAFATLGIGDLHGVEDVIQRGMSKNPRDRYPHIQDLAHALLEAAGQSARRSTATPSSPLLPAVTLPSLRNPPSPATTMSASVGAREASLAPKPPRRLWPLAIGVAVAAVALPAAYVAFRSTSTGGGAKPPAVSETSAARPSPPAAAPPREVIPDQISIELENLPAHAVVKVDDRLAKLPLRLPRGEQVHRLTISAEGYETQDQLISARKDLVVQSAMTRLPPEKARPQPKRSAPRRERGKSAESSESNVVRDLDL